MKSLLKCYFLTIHNQLNVEFCIATNVPHTPEEPNEMNGML